MYTDGVSPLVSRDTRIVSQKGSSSILVRQWNALCSRQTTRFLCTLYRSCQLYRVIAHRKKIKGKKEKREKEIERDKLKERDRKAARGYEGREERWKVK